MVTAMTASTATSAEKKCAIVSTKGVAKSTAWTAASMMPAGMKMMPIPKNRAKLRR